MWAQLWAHTRSRLLARVWSGPQCFSICCYFVIRIGGTCGGVRVDTLEAKTLVLALFMMTYLGNCNLAKTCFASKGFNVLEEINPKTWELMSLVGDMYMRKVDMEDLEANTIGHFNTLEQRKENDKKLMLVFVRTWIWAHWAYFVQDFVL